MGRNNENGKVALAKISMTRFKGISLDINFLIYHNSFFSYLHHSDISDNEFREI